MRFDTDKQDNFLDRAHEVLNAEGIKDEEDMKRRFPLHARMEQPEIAAKMAMLEAFTNLAVTKYFKAKAQSEGRSILDFFDDGRAMKKSMRPAALMTLGIDPNEYAKEAVRLEALVRKTGVNMDQLLVLQAIGELLEGITRSGL